MLFIPIHSIDLEKSPEGWMELFNKSWPAYQSWFQKEGLQARAGYLTSTDRFKEYFPELWPVYEKLCKQVNAGDIASRFLTMYCPPPYMSGCSQVAWIKDEPALVRNYDYSPKFFEGVVMKTNWLKPVIGMSDCQWGLLDGMNHDGLCASLTFGGRRITADGFGIPLIIRYCLETCSTTSEAIEKLKNIPAHMSYNVTLLDKHLDFATIYFIPGEPNQITYYQVGTNHQEEISWPDYAIMTRTVERRTILEQAVMDPMEHQGSLLEKFMIEPLFNTAYEKGFGTLYTAKYDPLNGSASYYWQGKQLHQSFEVFNTGKINVALKTSAHRMITL